MTFDDVLLMVACVLLARVVLSIGKLLLILALLLWYAFTGRL